MIILDYKELENLSDFELQGVLVHELAHLEIYSRMNWFELGFYVARYELFPEFRKRIEKEADLIVIQRSFGHELQAFREYRLRFGSEGDKKMLEDYYLSLEEIKNLTSSLG